MSLDWIALSAATSGAAGGATSLDWIALSAAAAGVVAGGAAVVALWYQVDLARGTSSIDNMVRMEGQWHSPEMEKRRASAAATLLKPNATAADAESDDLVAIMTFFEQLGYLVKEKAIKAEAAWEALSDWSLPWWVACYPFVKAQQDINRTYWENFASLNSEMVAVESRRRALPQDRVIPNPDSVHTFLVDERSVAAGDGGKQMKRSWRRRQFRVP